jgi:hypothetical protein
MPAGKYVKKAYKKTKKYAKKRYTTRTGGTRINKIAQDLYMVKRKLNSEHKNIDFKFGANQTIIAQTPTNSTPIVLPIPLPIRGTSYNDRIGNQIRIVHMTSKLKFLFKNNQDLTQRVNIRAQIVFAKDASNVPLISNLYDTDANGHYTPMSMVQTQEYKKFLWLKSHDHKKGYTQPTNRYPQTGSAGIIYTEPGTIYNEDITAQNVASQSLNDAPFYSNKSGSCSIKVMFQNGSDTTIEQMKPYLILRSDAIESGQNVYDPCVITGIIRMTYVDN